MADKATAGQEVRLLERATSRTRLHQEHDDECSDLSAKGDGLSITQTVLSMSAFTSGYGSMVIAVLVVSTGWLGLVTSGLIYSTVIFTMVLVGRCWNMIREKYPTERHPYGAIGFEAYGSRARTIMNILLVGCCFVAGAEPPLASSELLLLIGGPSLRGYFCYFPLAISIVACLLTWLKTPKDIWLVSLLSFTCNCVAFVTIFVGLILSNGESSNTINGDTPEETPVLHQAEIIGIVMAITAVHFIFPTLQQDMKEPSSAGKAVLLSAGVNAVAVSPIIVTLYITYGATLGTPGNASALTLLPDGAFKVLGSALIMVHLVQIILFTNNPLYQFLEEKLDIPSDFSWKRLVLRPLVIFLQMFLQETVPQINLYFAIVGGCFLPPIGLFAPALCYLRLKRVQLQESGIVSKPPKLFLLETVVCWVIMGVTPLVMAAVLYVTVSEMAAGRTVFTVPCYVNATLAHP